MVRLSPALTQLSFFTIHCLSHTNTTCHPFIILCVYQTTTKTGVKKILQAVKKEEGGPTLKPKAQPKQKKTPAGGKGKKGGNGEGASKRRREG